MVGHTFNKLLTHPDTLLQQNCFQDIGTMSCICNQTVWSHCQHTAHYQTGLGQYLDQIMSKQQVLLLEDNIIHMVKVAVVAVVLPELNLMPARYPYALNVLESQPWTNTASLPSGLSWLTTCVDPPVTLL